MSLEQALEMFKVLPGREPKGVPWVAWEPERLVLWGQKEARRGPHPGPGEGR